MPRNKTPFTHIRVKHYNLWFDGQDVEIFIKKAENKLEIEGSTGWDISRKIALWTKDKEISNHIAGIPGYETGKSEKLKVDIKRRWRTISTEQGKIFPQSLNYLQNPKWEKESSI
ncbi:hypothetical protein O181_002752 [Austropuccinia psidii MF-1]|uniref:Uncharacterized protein n=1 Tax=Austropuccinia psidii MF-1 TaxID=1389203 RepID=A0A9Q3BDD7_9BASI|nr:hypothetical protein [Austropuccinia psidii MF-1]